MNEFLKIEGLHKKFFLDSKEIHVLNGLDFSVHKGEIICIFGASGAGKSTLLHLIGLLDTPSEGKIIFDEQEVSRLNFRTLAKFRNQKIGFIFQFHHLLPEFTALENVVIPAMIARFPVQKSREKAKSLLDQLGLADRIDHKPGELSGGEQQRVAVARALINDPELVLADEPTGNLDSITGENIHNILRDLNQNRAITMIVVTHNIKLANIANRILKLSDGKICSFERADAGLT
ncbi:MAG: hypothetical protein A2161_13090 [Candidatus Schekmanbacteria bacterium RBG_13_48_7]|uniref:ABC transporter domain-containing protein n=1 Tax=Candidatus Schekmanbacteria bacterium RBG_13_48_7 TaxID=1817878 RepID=A0A1F7RKG7_9BACT|nr:MAG: hypothetical protein A2161_13090 [Candidatus Schekmanbacteria bacterium RBG_13_48_7]